MQEVNRTGGLGARAMPSSTRAFVGPVQNQLLASLPPADFDCLRPYLTRVPLRQRQLLQEPHLPMTHAYFPEQGVASLLLKPRGEGVLEMAVIARMGIIGVPIILGTMRSPHRCVVVIPGEALRISAGDLQRAMGECEGLRHRLLAFVQAVMIQNSHVAACNTRHRLEHRLARWLLVARDRIDDDQLPITHELLGKMLGVRRAGITVALGVLEKAGIVQGCRGCVTILDRERLREASCGCHRAISAEYDRLLIGFACVAEPAPSGYALG